MEICPRHRTCSDSSCLSLCLSVCLHGRTGLLQSLRNQRTRRVFKRNDGRSIRRSTKSYSAQPCNTHTPIPVPVPVRLRRMWRTIQLERLRWTSLLKREPLSAHKNRSMGRGNPFPLIPVFCQQAAAELHFDVADVADVFQGLYDFRRNLFVQHVNGDGVAAFSDLPGVVCAYVYVVVS